MFAENYEGMGLERKIPTIESWLGQSYNRELHLSHQDSQAIATLRTYSGRHPNFEHTDLVSGQGPDLLTALSELHDQAQRTIPEWNFSPKRINQIAFEDLARLAGQLDSWLGADTARFALACKMNDGFKNFGTLVTLQENPHDFLSIIDRPHLNDALCSASLAADELGARRPAPFVPGSAQLPTSAPSA